MRYFATAAMALALAASAAAASAADPQDDNNHDHGQHAGGGQGGGQHGGGGPGGGQGSHGGQPGGATATVPAGAVHVGPVTGGGGQGAHTVGAGQTTTGGNAFHGNGQSGGAGPQNFRGYGRGPGGYVAPGGQAGLPAVQSAPASGQHGGNWNGGQGGQHGGNGQAGQGGQGGQHGGAGNWNGQGGQHGGNAFNGGPRGGVPGANHALRGRDQGRGWFNPNRFPQQFHAERRFHNRWDNRPRGWYARSWNFGDFLPFGWFAPAYYLSYQDYGLPYPPVGCEWVRQGDDAVLVDIWTGEVMSVAYGVFW